MPQAYRHPLAWLPVQEEVVQEAPLRIEDARMHWARMRVLQRSHVIGDQALNENFRINNARVL